MTRSHPKYDVMLTRNLDQRSFEQWLPTIFGNRIHGADVRKHAHSGEYVAQEIERMWRAWQAGQGSPYGYRPIVCACAFQRGREGPRRK